MNKPIIILSKPQLAENIGMTARAMKNCALEDLRLISPREDHLSEKALSASSGADDILKNAKVFNTLKESVKDLEQLFATTARHRDMIKFVYTPDKAAELISTESKKSGILFGCERTGLENDDLILADGIIEIPLNPEHSSLNLSQAVLIVGYEWHKLQIQAPSEQLITNKTNVANKELLIHFLDYLENKLDDCGNFKQDGKPSQIRNLHNIFSRASLTEQEINTLYGVINHLNK